MLGGPGVGVGAARLEGRVEALGRLVGIQALLVSVLMLLLALAAGLA